MMQFDELFHSIELGIQQVYQSDQYQNYLKTMSRFTSYSLNNTILIFRQNPNATHVAGYQAWKTKFGRNVKKGEHGIRILAPVIMPKNKTGEDEPENEQILHYRAISVFDISQTEGKPLPAFMNDHIDGTVEGYEDFLDQLEQISPVPVRFARLKGTMHGYYSSKDREIVLARDMSELQTIKTLAHEIAHSVLHDHNEENRNISRCQKEIEAESVAYILCHHYGLDTSEYSFGYLAGYSSSKNLTELRASMETIRSASNRLILQLDHLRHPETESDSTEHVQL